MCLTSHSTGTRSWGDTIPSVWYIKAASASSVALHMGLGKGRRSHVIDDLYAFVKEFLMDALYSLGRDRCRSRMNMKVD